VGEATGRGSLDRTAAEATVEERRAVVLGSGNLGLVYLMEQPRRMTLEEIDDRHPRLIAALRRHPHIGWLLVESAERGPLVLSAAGSRSLADGSVDGKDPLAAFGPRAAAHLRRSSGFDNIADIMVGSFYDPRLDEGCAFEELICFHGGLGGPQTRPFILHPPHLHAPPEPIVGAAAVHRLLKGWREGLRDSRAGDRLPGVPAALPPGGSDRPARAPASPADGGDPG
jgi:hypothetical protein